MLESLKLFFARKHYPTHRATTPQELDAIARFRYRVYVEELGFRDHPAADHDTQKMVYDDDLADSTWLLYAGKPDAIEGTLRLRIFEAGAVPAEASNEYSLDMFPDIERRKISDVSGLMFSRSTRGTASATMLCCRAVEIASGSHCEAIFSVGSAGLLRAYQRLGFRPYGGRIYGQELGMQLQIPLIAMLDMDYLRRIESPAYHVLRGVKSKGGLSSGDIQPLLDVIEAGRDAVVSGADRVGEEIEDLFAEGPAHDLLSQLPTDLVGELSRSGSILSVAAGDQLIRSDAYDNVLYYVLDGVLEVRRGDVVLGHHTKGETVGEVAFFRPGGLRSADVFAKTQARVLILSKGFLEKLERKQPEVACVFYRAICRVMAERIALR
jgi:hypothetical protein